MVFQEQKTETGYHYKTEDVFGSIDIDSAENLDADTLDAMVLLLLKQGVSAETVKGTVVTATGPVTYCFKKAPMWSEDTPPLPELLCKDIHTSTLKRVSAKVVTYLLRIRIINWCRRFVAAFLKAWKNEPRDN